MILLYLYVREAVNAFTVDTYVHVRVFAIDSR